MAVRDELALHSIIGFRIAAKTADNRTIGLKRQVYWKIGVVTLTEPADWQSDNPAPFLN